MLVQDGSGKKPLNLGRFSTLLGMVLSLLMFVLAVWQTTIAQKQVSLAEEQMRSKKQIVNMSATERYPLDFDGVTISRTAGAFYKKKQLKRPRVVHVHIENLGEIPIDNGNFQLGPYITFNGQNVVAIRQNTCRPPDFRVELTFKDRMYVQIKPLVEFKTNDFISVDVLLDGEIGGPTYTYRIKGGGNGHLSLPVDMLNPNESPVLVTPGPIEPTKR